jgi:formylglycine-generating enzyme required for sulfatase activity
MRPFTSSWAPVFALLALSCAAANQPASQPAAAEPAPPLVKGVAERQAGTAGRMARVPGATYRMGSEVGEPDERPVHEVQVSAFDMDLTEVTVAEYGECVRAGGCASASRVVHFPGATPQDQSLYGQECNDDRIERQDHAENCVDWAMADAYCRWAGKRLPTEEEWEYAACGGNCEQALGGRGGLAAILGAARWPFTTRVAKVAPGPFGLYDMAGNVWEWTASRYCPYDHPGCGDPRRVVRGGSWSMADVVSVRLTDRSPADPTSTTTNVGFRCARSASM